MNKPWPTVIFQKESPLHEHTICDSSSNSDEENEENLENLHNNRKRVAKRLYFENKKTAVKRRKMLDYVKKKFKFKCDEKKRNQEESYYNICDQTENTAYDILNTSQCADSSPQKEYSLSPILNVKKYRRSPILEKKIPKRTIVLSPVLSKKFRRIKKNENLDNTIAEQYSYCTNIMDETINLSSNLEIINSNSQESLQQANIENSDESPSIGSLILSNPSPESSFKVDVENSSTSQRTLHEIQNILSLPSTPLKNKFDSNQVDFIYKSSPIKRKYKPKKGTLAHRLQELLKSQRSSVSFWRHEHYLESTSSFKRTVNSEEEELVLKLTVNKIKVEYDRIFLECLQQNHEDEQVLLILSKHFLENGIVEDSTFVVYPPYIRRKLNINRNLVDVIFNAHKIMYNNKLI